MSISTSWDPDQRIWTLKAGETFEMAEVAHLIRETDWRKEKLFLWDLRALTKGPGSTGELQQGVDLVERSREQWNGSRAAIVVARDVDYGIARMFSAFADAIGVEYGVFREVAAGVDWLHAAPRPE